MSSRCAKDEILRKGYTKKSGSKVSAICIKDKSRLDLSKNSNVHLSQYGYSHRQSVQDRHEALRKASVAKDPLKVLRRLNLIRNYQSMPDIKEVFDKDVEYMQNYYSKHKKSKGKMKGGNVDSSEEVMIDSDGAVVNKPAEKAISLEEVTNHRVNCESGNCQVDIRVYESHSVDGRTVVFKTLDDSDIQGILKLDKTYLDANTDSMDIETKLDKHKGMLIGLIIDDSMQGYFQYYPLDNNTVEISYFCANKTFRKVLYTFMESFFRKNNYASMYVTVDLANPHAKDLLNLWAREDFQTEDVIKDGDKSKIKFSKDL
jgi:hypothetical protein